MGGWWKEHGHLLLLEGAFWNQNEHLGRFEWVSILLHPLRRPRAANRRLQAQLELLPFGVDGRGEGVPTLRACLDIALRLQQQLLLALRELVAEGLGARELVDVRNA